MTIAHKTITMHLPKGEIVVKEGDPGDALYMVIYGELVVIKGRETDRVVVLDRMAKDQFLGEMALIDRNPRSATVRTESDSLLLVLKAEDFQQIMNDYYSIPLNICKVLSQRIRTLQKRLRDFSNKSKSD